MKALRFLAVAVVVGFFLHVSPAFGQKAVATFSKEAMDNLAPLLDKAAKADGFVMEPGTTTIFGGWLPRGQKQGNERWISILVGTKLDPNKDYRIVAAGDNDTLDLDLRILDPAGAVVVEDVRANRDGEVTFRPARQQDYTIQIRLYDSKDNCVCVGAMLTK